MEFWMFRDYNNKAELDVAMNVFENQENMEASVVGGGDLSILIKQTIQEHLINDGGANILAHVEMEIHEKINEL